MDTKARLLDAAERLFAERGVAETSLRDITSLADANLASVNYHFGSKDALLHALCDSRLRPVNRERLALLSAFEAAAGEAPVALERIIYANLAPPFRRLEELGTEAERFMRVVARINADPSSTIHQEFLRHFTTVKERFLAALGKALPDVEAEEVERRLHFSLAAMMHAFCWGPRIPCLCAAPASSRDALLASLIGYAVAGMRAEPTGADLARLRDASVAAMAATT